MAKRINNIHDKFVKASFSDPERAVSFFEKNLPEDLLNEINLSTLHVINESYIQGNLSEHFSDIVFEVTLKDGDKVDLVLLFEHKSSPDKYVLVQVGHYVFSHWFKCISERKDLKLIIPLIYYQGKKQWKVPELSRLFPKIKGTLSKYIPILKHIFIALNSLPDENIKQIQNRLMAAAVMAQKKGPNIMKLAEDVVKIFELFPDNVSQGNFLEQIFVYVVSNSDLTKQEFSKAIESIPLNIKDNIMTTYSRIKEEGKIEGKMEGKIEEQIKCILNGYDNDIEISLLSNITQLSEDDVLNILRKHSRVE